LLIPKKFPPLQYSKISKRKRFCEFLRMEVEACSGRERDYICRELRAMIKVTKTVATALRCGNQEYCG
jgi:hypothetical protein